MSTRIGIIGAGAIGRVHATAIQDLGLSIGGIVDIDPKAGKKLAEDFGGVPTMTDSAQLFADKDIDAVIVAVPNVDHASLAIAAMQAGKDVLLEKPMGMNAQQCKQINQVARENERVLQIGYVHRYSAVGQAAKKFIDSGDLGNIYHVKAQLSRRRGIPGLGGWFTTRAESGGGPLIDIGVHVIDLVMYLLGGRSPVRVSGKAYSNFGSPIKDYVYESMWAGPPRPEGVFDVEDEAHALLHFDDGATLALDVAWAANAPAESVPENLMGFFGDKGGLTFQLYGDHLNLATEVNRHNADSKIFLPDVKMYNLQIEGFLQAVKDRSKPMVTGQQGEAVQSVIDAIYQSSETGREVAISCGR